MVTTSKATSNFIDLFNHENLRVFSDRLVDEIDEKWFVDMMNDVNKKVFGETVNYSDP